MNDKLELTRFEDVKTLLPNFAAGTVIPGEIVSNTQTQSVETIFPDVQIYHDSCVTLCLSRLLVISIVSNHDVYQIMMYRVIDNAIK
jgi:hypothetical protein